MAVDAVVSHLKSMSKPVTTPEEIAQVNYNEDIVTMLIFKTYKNSKCSQLIMECCLDMKLL